MNVPKLALFLGTVVAQYHDLPFHNIMHIRDVVGKMVVLLTAETCPAFTSLQKCALIVGAAVHDIDHQRINIAELIRTKHAIAVKHPMSPLESHHFQRCYNV